MPSVSACAQHALRLGKIDEALDSLGRAAQLDPNSAEIQNVLASH